MEVTYIGTRIDATTKDLIETVAREQGMNTSSFLRFVLRRELANLSFLPTVTKKAFGLEH
jgi:antitoxin component of RelBE/YafQ-DinJ toxin-antitoxin module